MILHLNIYDTLEIRRKWPLILLTYGEVFDQAMYWLVLVLLL